MHVEESDMPPFSFYQYVYVNVSDAVHATAVVFSETRAPSAGL